MDIEIVKINVVVQGGPVVNCGHVYAKGGAVVALGVDMQSKYCLVEATTGGKFPGVIIAASDRSLNLAPGKKDRPTFIEFTGYAGWSVWSADIGRYTLAVCLVKDRDNSDRNCG